MEISDFKIDNSDFQKFSGAHFDNISKVNINNVMLTNPCFRVFDKAFRVLHFFCRHFQVIFSFN